jgi:erythritol transport system ATP-binding protein
MSESPVILRAHAISKRYGGSVALDHVDFCLHRAAVNVLIGENGAGKSTLMRILAGVETPDTGSIELDGHPIRLRSPLDASACGIAIVHQELSVMPNLDLSENIFAGRELTRAAIIDRSAEDLQTHAALARLRKSLPARTPASHLSLGSRQIVEVARALAHGARILILDEPTSALSVVETQTLYSVVEDLKAAGVTIVYISHRLHELLHLGDHFTVLRSGKVVGQATRADATRQWIVERMSGRADTSDLTERRDVSQQPVLAVTRLSLPPGDGTAQFQTALHDVSFSLRRGEILAIYGLLGSGRTELVEALAGCRSGATGTLAAGSLSAMPRTVREAMDAGIALVPEDRQRDGLIPELSVRENIALSTQHKTFVSKKEESSRVHKLVAELNIAARDIELPVTALSGGNQQKVLIARCLMTSPSVLLLDEPTRGVDVGAKVEIYRVLRRLAANGMSILFTSSEIEETRLLADRALVLCQGRIAGEFSRSQLTDAILFAAASPSTASSSSTRSQSLSSGVQA